MTVLESAYQIGRAILESEGVAPEDSIYLNPGASHLLILRFSTTGEEVDGHSLEVVEYNPSSHLRRYPYRKPPSSGSGVVPTCLLNVSSPEKTLDKKIKGWFNKRKKDKTLPFASVTKYMESNLDNLSMEVSERVSRVTSSNRDANFVITAEFSDPSLNEKYQNYIQGNLLGDINKKFSVKHSVESRGFGECFFCAEEKEVNGFASPYTFYTHDKVTYASGFDRSTTWRNFPVCSTCALTTERGAKYVGKNMSFRFHGISYLLFPKMIHEGEMGMRDFIEQLQEGHVDQKKERSENSQPVSLSRLTDDDREILHELVDERNYATLTFLFYQMNNSQFEILNVVNDVLPSRLSALFDAKDKLERNSELQRWWVNLPWRDGEADDFNFNYGFLRDIYPSSYVGEKGKQDLYKVAFLALVAASLKKSPVERASLLVPISRIMQYLMANRREYETRFYHFAMKSLVLYEYFVEIGCVKVTPRSDITMEETLRQLQLEKTQLPRAVLKVVEENHYFDHPAKIACFITGILVREVARQQHKNLNSSPFYEKLDGMKLTPRKVKRIFSEAIGKLIEYSADSFEMKGLETLASHFFMKENLDLSNEDLCFSVGLGLSYGSAIWSNYNKKESDNDD